MALKTEVQAINETKKNKNEKGTEGDGYGRAVFITKLNN